MPSSWLFTKDNQSIHVVRPHGCALVIEGPDQLRQRENFSDESTLQRYQIAMAERLAESGWILFGINQQRRSGERRAAQRQTAERRAVPLL